jgi:uncharacterized protein
MPTQYLHGVETIESEIGGQTVELVKSAVVALFGIAPTGPANSLTLCLSDTDDAQFGDPVPGFNIPKTLGILRAMAGGFPVLVVNTFNPGTNLKQVTNEAQTVANGGFTLASAPIGAIALTNANGTAASVALGSDYTVDSYGNVTALTVAMANGTAFMVSYNTLDATTLTPGQLIGGVDGSGNRTGLALYDLAYNTFGYRPKIFVSPGNASTSAVISAMAAQAAKQRAVYAIDAPQGTTVSEAIAGRGVGGTFGFNTQDDRALLLFPYLQSYDEATNEDAIYPYSAFMAGLIVATDNNLGYWYSPSNKQITAATGIERVIEWSLNDAGCEANQLNGAGIITIAAGYGTGLLAWGNRNAAFPVNSEEKNFISLRRTDDMVSEAMEQAALPFVDQPLTQGTIDAMRESGNALMRALIQRGAILPGSKVIYNKADNPASQLAAGQVVFTRDYMIPTPAERITFKDVIDVSLLSQLS